MKNAGYEIIHLEKYDSRYGIALGENKETGMYVTWECMYDKISIPVKEGEISYFWGHYFTDRTIAYKDYHTRLATQYDKQLQYEKEPG